MPVSAAYCNARCSMTTSGACAPYYRLITNFRSDELNATDCILTAYKRAVCRVKYYVSCDFTSSTVSCCRVLRSWWSVISPASSTGLQVVRKFCSSHVRWHTLHFSRTKTTLPMNNNFWTNDNVHHMETMPNCVTIGFTEAASHVGEICNSQSSVSQHFFSWFRLFFLFRQIVYRSQTCDEFRRMVAQKTWFGERISLLRPSITIPFYRGFKISQNCSSREIPPKTKT